MPETPRFFRSSRSDVPGSAEPFCCNVRVGARASAWVYVCGELDIATTPALRDALADAQSRARLVVLDLQDVTFLDSAAAHRVLEAVESAPETAGRVVVLRPGGEVRTVFDLLCPTDGLGEAR